MIDARYDVKYMGEWLSILQAAVTFGGMKGFLYPILLPPSGGVSLHL